MFKNKHVIVALIVAPILAIIAYFSVDYFVAEQPHKAKVGNAYELIAKPNCRYASGKCELKNGDFEITLKAEYPDSDKTILLEIISNFALDAVKIAIISPEQPPVAPLQMQALNKEKTLWQIELEQPESTDSKIRLVALLDKVKYYAETGMKFTRLESILPNYQKLKDGN